LTLSRYFWQTAPVSERRSRCLPQHFWGPLEPALAVTCIGI